MDVAIENGVALAVVPSAVVADQFTDARVKLIREKFGNNAPELEFDLFMAVCRRTGLAPEHKQIYFIQRGGKWTIQTSIDGYRLIADRTRRYAGSDDAIYQGEGKLTNGKTHPLKATVTVWKMVEGVRCPFTASALWAEYNAGSNLWLTMPYVMLAKCAESLALRKAFPAELSGLYTGEEMAQADHHDAPPPVSARVVAQPTAPAVQEAAFRPAAEEPVFDGPALKAFAKGHGLNSLPEIEAYVGRPIKGVKAADIRDMILAKLDEQANDAEPLWDRVEPENPKAEQPATKPQIAKIFATAGEKLGDDREGIKALIATVYGSKHADDLSKAEATEFIDYLVKAPTDVVRGDVAAARAALAEAAGQRSLPIDGPEADLITFRERVEAAVSTGEAEPLVALFAEAEGRPERWIELIRSTTNVLQLNAMIRHASTREQYGVAVSAAAEAHRVALQQRADAKRN